MIHINIYFLARLIKKKVLIFIRKVLFGARGKLTKTDEAWFV